MGTRSVDVRPMGMAGSASVPSLGTKAGPRPGPGRAKARPSSAQALADIGRLEDENEVLRLAVQRERTKYGQKSLKDFNSPARRRLGPMRRLLSEQAEVASVQTCALAQKEQALGLVSGRAKQELAMQARRQADLEVQEGRLAEVKLKQAEEEAHSAKAWEEHAVYAMMERRLQRLAAEDNGKITKVQEQIQDCDLRLGQWISVCKEGEGELAKAEGELEAMMQQLKAERQNRKKRLADRRSMAESMLQYTKERQERMDAHKDRLLAQRGDLSRAEEEKLRVQAGTIDALRAIHEPNAKHALTYEERCKEAFQHVENLTGAKDLEEVLFVITSKRQLTEQLQRRVYSTERRQNDLGELKESLSEEASSLQFGGGSDPKVTEAIAKCREQIEAVERENASQAYLLNGAMRTLSTSRLAWENLVNLMQPIVAPPRASSSHSRPPSALGGAALSVVLGNGGGARARRGTPSMSSQHGDGSVSHDQSPLPAIISELPKLVDEASARATKLLSALERAEARVAERSNMAVGEGRPVGEGRRGSEPVADAPPGPPGPPGPPSPSQKPPSGEKAAEKAAKPLSHGERAAAAAAKKGLSSEDRQRQAAAALMSEALPSNNVRVMPAHLAAELETAMDRLHVLEQESPSATRSNSPGSERPNERGARGRAAREDAEALPSREVLKLEANRLVRKEARKLNSRRARRAAEEAAE